MPVPTIMMPGPSGQPIGLAPFSSGPIVLVSTAFKDLTVAQVNALNVTPIDIVPAGGPGTILMPISWTVHKKMSVNFASSVILSILYAGQAVAQAFSNSQNPSLGSAPNDRVVTSFMGSGSASDSNNLIPADSTAMVNKALQVMASGSAGGSPVGTVRVSICYRLMASVP